MPPTVNPQPLIVNHLHDSEPRWFAVHTRSKSEKFVQRMLAKKGIHAWLPLQKLLRRYTRSTRWVEKPLINSYIFVKITKDQYVPVLETENVAGFVKFSKNLVAIPEAEIDILKRITLEDGLDVEVVPGNLAEGDPVEISAGNLMGLKGRIVKSEGKRKFQVELHYLFHSLLITVDAAFLEKTRLTL
jgi:transcription antitermination factor NusG